MKRCSVFLMSIILIVSGCAGLGVATVGAVIYYNSSKHEVATVNIKAGADNVFKVAMDTIKKNQALEVTSTDDISRLVEIRKENRSASIKVSDIGKGYTQITITADALPAPESGTKFVLDGVFAICEKMNAKCTLANNGK